MSERSIDPLRAPDDTRVHPGSAVPARRQRRPGGGGDAL